MGVPIKNTVVCLKWFFGPDGGGMAKPLRMQFEGAIYHVMNRGIDRRLLFWDEKDRRLDARLRKLDDECQ